MLFVVALLLCCAAAAMAPSPPAAIQRQVPSPPVTTVTPEQFGARADGHQDDTSAVRAAVASCARHAASCRVLFAAEKTYLCGPFIVASSGVTLDIRGKIVALPRVEGCETKAGCYPRSGAAQSEFPSFLTANGVSDLTLTGGGSVDGRGEPWWPCKHSGCWRPHLLNFSSVTRLAVRDLALVDSPNHFVRVNNCTHVRVERVRMTAPHTSPNTDGINFAGGADQLLSNCTIHNGDDCVSVITYGPGAGSSSFAVPCQSQPQLCRGGNVLVEDLVCDGGHGASIGSVRHGLISNVTFRRVKLLAGPTQTLDSGGGCRVKSYPNGSGSVSHIRYEDIDIAGVAYPLQILAAYCPKSQKPWPCPPGDGAVNVHDISFARIRGFGKTAQVGSFDCGIVPCTGISLSDVQLRASPSGGGAPRFECSNCSGTASNTSPPSCFKSVQSFKSDDEPRAETNHAAKYAHPSLSLALLSPLTRRSMTGTAASRRGGSGKALPIPSPRRPNTRRRSTSPAPATAGT